MRRLLHVKEKVIEEFIQHWKDNDWNKRDTRENLNFLEKEREIHIEMFPEEAQLLDELEDEYNNSGNTNDDEGAECLA